MNILLILAFSFFVPVVISQTEQSFSTSLKDMVIGMGAAYTEVELYRRNEENYLDDNEWIHVASNVTDAGGRMRILFTPDEFPIGVYRLVFQTGKYYEAKNLSTFYPYLEILFKKSNMNPILIVISLSPYGYTYDFGFDVGLTGTGTTSHSPAAKNCFISVLCIMFYMFYERNL